MDAACMHFCDHDPCTVYVKTRQGDRTCLDQACKMTLALSSNDRVIAK